MREPTELSYAECRTLLARGRLGRAAVSTPEGPRIIPLNYVVADDSIIFRTKPYSLLGTYAGNSNLAFEVDEVDEVTHQGWSVIAIGHAARIEDPDEVRAVAASANPDSWAGGTRSMYFRLRWRELTGRRLVGSV
jgi:nitroimidazol reductase NimA-like FMN-containing flavoprotein (pyridoxamine 5'-phosphate oxidase superfamily)